MSTTFSAEMVLAGFALSCGCPDAKEQAPRFGAYQDAYAELEKIAAAPGYTTGGRAPLPGCERPEYCVYDGLRVVAFDAEPDADSYSVNMSAGNAIRVTEMLGYRVDRDSDGYPVDEPHGNVDPEDFHGRVLMSLGLVPGTVEADRPVFGYRAGYPELDRLEQLARWCKKHGRRLTWG